MPVQTQIQLRRGTAASWTSTNPTLGAGEIGFETDTGNFKIGNGSTAWASLAYNLNGGVSTSGGSTITVASGSTVPLTIQNNGTGNSFRVNDVASDTTPFIIDADGNVGIGQSAPSSKLAVIGASASIATFTDNTNATITIATPSSLVGSIISNQTLALNAGGFERMRVDSSGLVGIGAVPSGAMFTVVNTIAGNASTIIKGAASQTGDQLQIQNSAGSLQARFNNNGQLGVGVSPSYNLDAAASGGDLYLLRLTNTNSANTTAKSAGMIFSGTDTVGSVKPAVVIKAFPEDANYVGAGMIIATRSGDTVTDRVTVTGNGDVRFSNQYYAAKNFLINGGMDIWQRGTSFSVGAFSTTYTADRWSTFNAATCTISRETSIVPTGQQYAFKLTGTGSSYEVVQAIETSNAILLAGKTVTFSVQIAGTSGKTPNVLIDSSTSTDVSPWPNTNWTNIAFAQITTAAGNAYTTATATVAVPSNVKSLRVRIQSSGLSSGEVQYYAAAQLELGTIATTFSRAGGDIQGELAACQRYYYRATLDAVGARLGAGYVNSTIEINLTVPFPVTMRTKPTALEQSGTATDYQVLTTGNTITTCNAVPTISTATQAMQAIVSLGVASGLVAGQGATMRVATANAYLGWSAEL